MLKTILEDCLIKPKLGSYEILNQSIVRIKTFKGAVQDMNYTSTGFIDKLEYLDLEVSPQNKIGLKEKGIGVHMVLPAKTMPMAVPTPKPRVIEEIKEAVKEVIEDSPDLEKVEKPTEKTLFVQPVPEPIEPPHEPAKVPAEPESPKKPEEAILAAMAKLDPADKAHFTKKGMPDATVLTEMVGFWVSVKVRDELYTKMLDELETKDAEVDKAGKTFDPEKHQVTKLGNPRKAFGNFVKIKK